MNDEHALEMHTICFFFFLFALTFAIAGCGHIYAPFIILRTMSKDFSSRPKYVVNKLVDLFYLYTNNASSETDASTISIIGNNQLL